MISWKVTTPPMSIRPLQSPNMHLSKTIPSLTRPQSRSAARKQNVAEKSEYQNVAQERKFRRVTLCCCCCNRVRANDSRLEGRPNIAKLWWVYCDAMWHWELVGLRRIEEATKYIQSVRCLQMACNQCALSRHNAKSKRRPPPPPPPWSSSTINMIPHDPNNYFNSSSSVMNNKRVFQALALRWHDYLFDEVKITHFRETAF